MIGETVLTTRQLSELPSGTILRTNGGQAMLVVGNEQCCVTCLPSGGHGDMAKHLPAVVLWHQGEGLRPERVVKAQALREAAWGLYESERTKFAMDAAQTNSEMLSNAGVDIWLEVRANQVEAGEL